MTHQGDHSPFSISQEDGPFTIHRVHVPVTIVNELHHVFPMEWQRDVWGEVRDQTKQSVCSTGHNNVHAALRFYDRYGEWPKWCRGKTRALANEAVKRRAAAIAALR